MFEIFMLELAIYITEPKQILCIYYEYG